MLNIKIGFYILLLLSSNVFSQTIRFDSYTTKNGLLSDEIYNLHQDKKGYMWIFTNYGVVKYNSKEFKHVLKNLPFNESFIYSIYENKKGQKWIANSNGKIYEIINDSAFVVKGTELTSASLKKNVSEIFQLYVDDSLNIYAITKHYSYKFVKNDSYHAINLSSCIENDSIIYRVYDKDGILLPIYNYAGKPIPGFFSKRKKLNIEIYNNKEVIPFKIACKSLTGTKYFKRFEDGIYIALYNRLVKISNQKSISYINFDSQILNFIKDKNKHLWVVCFDKGLIELNEKDSIIHNYFKNKRLHDVIIDSQNGLWVSSYGEGLFHCENLNNLYYDQSDPLSNPISFIKKIENKLFIANIKGDVFMFEKNKVYHIRKYDQMRNNPIGNDPLDIIKYHSNYLISYRDKLEQFDFNNQNKFRTNDNITYAYSLALFGKDSVVCIKRKEIRFLVNGVLKKTIAFNYKVFFCEQRKNKLLFATENGLYELIGDSLIQPGYLSPTKNTVITRIVKDIYNNVWCSSMGEGLFKLTENNKLFNYSVSNGLPSNIINSISFNEDSSIFLSTNKGLFYSKNNNIPADKMNWNNIYSQEVKDAFLFENKVYIDSKSRIIILDYKKISDSKHLYFNLNLVFVNSKQIEPKALNNLNHNQNNLEFNFDLIHFYRDKFKFIYHLSGPIQDSGTTENSSLRFLNLIPGNYLLTIYPNTYEGKKVRIKISFNIIPAFWQTWWFLVLCVCGLIVVIFFIIWSFFRYYKNKEFKKNEANRLLSEYSLIALKAQINPHFMSNCLAAIQHLIISDKVDEANEYLAKFSFLVRQILNFSTKSFITLNEEIEIINLYIELEQLRFENKFTFNLNLDPLIDADEVVLPPLLLQPIIENAIWHGLLPLNNERVAILALTIQKEVDALIITIQDNGVGRRIDNTSISNSKESKGIAITTQRIQNLKTIYDYNLADMMYEDLVDEENKPLGTRVIIHLPINLQENE